MNKVIYFLFIAFAVYLGCAEKPPTAFDGDASLVVVALWDSTATDSVDNLIPLQNAKVILTSQYGMMVRSTDDEGKLILTNLPSSTYSISVRLTHPDDPNIMLIGSTKEIEIISGKTTYDTIYTKPISSTGIAINEIYSAGPVNNIFFFFDQFIELYNASDSVRYLDGMMVMRVSGNNDGKGPGADEDDDGDIDGATFVFKFPGKPEENNYPIYPKQFIVLASDAVDHRKIVATSIDLSDADWEFYNQYSAEDIDNPSVPNLINMRSDRTADFLINLVGDVIVISSGVDSVWADGIDISTVIDGVEYQSMPHPQSKKTLDNRVDRGYVLSPPRYSGRSMQRREPGVDTNDSSNDFEIISPPTPGRQ